MKWYIAITLLITLVSLVGLGIIVSQFDPETASLDIRVLFFLSFFLALWGLGTFIFSLLAILLRRGLPGMLKHYWRVRAADFSVYFRRGFLLALGVMSVIFLRWWKGPDSFFPGIAILFLIMIEFWNIQRSRAKNSVDDFS